MVNSKSTTTMRRILKEAAELNNSPSPDFSATPVEDNLFEWHFTIRGPPGEATPAASQPKVTGTSNITTGADTPPATTPTVTSFAENIGGGVYSQGMYHGRIVLPPTYPLRPPSFRFLTPSGRFETNRAICLSISGHHEETWQPAWGLRTALVALRSFMESDSEGHLGGFKCTDAMRRQMATASRSWKCAACAKTNLEILTESAEAAEKANIDKMEEEVPKELKMEWKDEMEKKTNDEDDGESAVLAEGFVQTAPLLQEVVPTREEVQRTPYPAASPVQGVPLPTASVSAPLVQQRAPQVQRARGQSNDGVPKWVDVAIVGIVISLLFLILKMILVP